PANALPSFSTKGGLTWTPTLTTRADALGACCACTGCGNKRKSAPTITKATDANVANRGRLLWSKTFAAMIPVRINALPSGMLAKGGIHIISHDYNPKRNVIADESQQTSGAAMLTR